MPDTNERRCARCRHHVGCPARSFRNARLSDAEHEIADVARVSEAHFVLRRMHVDVDLPRIEIEIQHEHRMAAVEQHVAVRLLHRVRDDLVLHRTAVDEEILMIGLCARKRRHADPTVQVQVRRVFRRSALPRLRTRRRAVARRGAVHPLPLGGRCCTALPLRVSNSTSSRAKRETGDDVVQMRELGAFGLQELAARGRVVEQIGDVDGRAARMRDRPTRGSSSPFTSMRQPLSASWCLEMIDLRNRRDTGERFAAKAECRDAFEIVGDIDFARCMRTHRKRQIVGMNADAVVGHTRRV